MESVSDEVILVGLDGLGFGEIGQWIDGGILPTLSSLADNTATDLKSTHPPWTPCAWPSLLSGRNPGKHGVFDFFKQEGYEKQLIERSDVDSPYLFDVTAECGLTPVVINYPITHSALNIENGAMVPGYLTSEDTPFHPPHLREQYEAENGKYRIYPDYGTDDDPIAEYVDVARHRRDIARFLDERFDWDLLAVQFQVTDSVFHDLDDREQIREVLENVDEFVGDIIDLGDDDTTVIIASDHGMGDYDWTFYVNSWLAEHGYCETTEGEAQYFRQQKDKLKGKSDESKSSSTMSKAVSTTANTLSKVGLSPRRIHSALESVGLASHVERILPADALVAAQNQVVDHENSIAYQLLFNSLGIHLNVEGREPHGMVPQNEYEEVRSELIDELKEIRDPDGKLVFDDVRPREEVYEGKHVEDAPDIILFPRDFRYDVSGSILDTFRRNPHKNHKPEGILISNRDLNVDPEKGASIYDIAPTVAAELEIPVDTNTDGRVLTDVEETVERQDWDELAGDYASGGSDQDTSSVEDRLADLGYME
ncbi:alkaline phosphatase family protein [Halobaculum magnesiiphilum]|uniref:Alkaline phosphatase family protein n=1 Tax=Halobaculum magnesiiphilum TaxID=1017351 RepID=A0A8T8WEI4_9EURY|nr:alkaline phosphatase family protein [Halobaculum magnesiiphilum]QZP38248.1 alkaline phosphatase family protein [Halobaculum magnesiiphilum]